MFRCKLKTVHNHVAWIEEAFQFSVTNLGQRSSWGERPAPAQWETPLPQVDTGALLRYLQSQEIQQRPNTEWQTQGSKKTWVHGPRDLFTLLAWFSFPSHLGETRMLFRAAMRCRAAGKATAPSIYPLCQPQTSYLSPAIPKCVSHTQSFLPWAIDPFTQMLPHLPHLEATQAAGLQYNGPIPQTGSSLSMSHLLKRPSTPQWVIPNI